MFRHDGLGNGLADSHAVGTEKRCQHDLHRLVDIALDLEQAGQATIRVDIVSRQPLFDGVVGFAQRVLLQGFQ